MSRFRSEREADGRWLAEDKEHPGVMAYGKTQAEAEVAVRELAERVAEKCPTCGGTGKCIAGYLRCLDCGGTGHTAPAETAEQRLAKAVGINEQELDDLTVADYVLHWEPIQVSLWNHALRLEREHQVMREALEKISAKTCCCMSSDPDWHYETCWKFFALSALSQIGKP